MIELEKIEKSIIKKYRKEIWRPFVRALKDFSLINEGDHVIVGISGGKDSLLLAKILQELQKHSQINFKLSFLSMDPGFSYENRKNIEMNCKELNIDVQIFDSNIFGILNEKKMEQKPCYLCARMRRGFLYEHAKKIGANKLALGHHMDDVIETIMLNVLYGGCYGSMLPILKSKNFSEMELIRPLYYVEEKNIISWKNYCQIDAMDCGCAVARKELDSKRLEIKNLIKEMEKYNKNVKNSILKSCENVYMDTIIGYKKDGNNYNKFNL